MKTLPFASMAVIACALALLAPKASLASPLTTGSQLNISGAGIVSATSLTFQCNQPGDTVCASPPAGYGDFAVANSTGDFAQYNGTFGLIRSINNFDQPLNTIFSLPNFIIFDLNNNITIELTFIPVGNDPVSPTCAGLQHCTPSNPALVTSTNPSGLSAFNLDQNLTGTAATFGIRGIAHSIDGSTAQLSGIYTTQFTGLTPEQVLLAALSGSAQTYSANMVLNVVSTQVPEPVSMLLTGAGLIGLAAFRFKKRS